MPKYSAADQDDVPPFLRTQSSTGETWDKVLDGVKPKKDQHGFLSGEWGRCMVAAARYEHSHPEWSEMPHYADNGPGGYVIEYLNQLGFGNFEDAADQLEEATRSALEEEEGLSRGPDDPEVWSTPICNPKGFDAQIAETMRSTFWCCVNPLLCCGFGIGECKDPFFVKASKCCCCEAAFYTDDCCGDEGACFNFSKTCCLVTHMTCWPGGGPDDGVPMCACCNMRCGGESDADSETNTNAKILESAFLCYYALCCGCGLSMGFPLVKADTKCCCTRCFASTASCCPKDRGMCYDYFKCCCCVSAFTFPCGGASQDGIPACACCGKGCGNEEEGYGDGDSGDEDGRMSSRGRELSLQSRES